MPPPRRPRLPLLLRITIVIGMTTFLLGLSGAITLAVIRDRSPASNDRRAPVGLLRLHPAPTVGSIDVDVRWELKGGAQRAKAQPSETESEAAQGIWVVSGVPHGPRVDIEVFRTRPDGRRVFLTRVPAVLTEDAIIDIPLP